ncbi:MAG: transglycosylase domain-containing protein, partial [Gallionella sp.]|nr:transglycosylase domain-containing protein [Gallionella sp.]
MWRACWLLLACLFAAPLAWAGEIPTFDQVKADYRPSDVALLDRHGEVIHRLRVDLHVRRLEWVALADISPALIAATIQAEDRHFYQHGGVDWPALAKVAVESLFGDKQRGASTLTMQLAAMLDPALKPKRYQRSYAQKWSQINAASELEQHWSKAQIIEAYFNLAFFRGELHGVGAAAAGLFKKRPDGLDEAESFLLASLLRGPNAAVAQVASRACRLAADMASGTACPEIRARAETTLDKIFIEPDVAL